MSDLLNSSGSDKLGVARFYKKTGRIEARKFEDNKALSFLDLKTYEIKEELQHIHLCCPLCGNIDFIEIFNKDGYHHQRCITCNFIFVNPCLSQDAIINGVYGTTEYPFFESVNSDSQREFDKIRFESVIKYITENFPEKKSIYDIGCGSGYFLQLCRENGFDSVGGIDALKKAQVYAVEALQLENVEYGDFRDLKNKTEKYDVVSMWELLDHVVEPRELLKIASNLLKPGGLMIISVRNGFSLAARILRDRCNMFLGYAHTNFWNVDTFDLICKDYNLSSLQLKTYISELAVINNYLQYEDPYSSKTEILDFLPSQEEIIDNLYGYKFIAILQKTDSQ